LSTLGKILTVLIVLVAIPVAVLVSREFYVRENWKAEYGRAAAQFEVAKRQRESAQQKAEEQRRLREAQQSTLQNTIDNQQGQIASLNNQLTILREERATLQKQVEGLNNSYDAMSKKLEILVADLASARGERDVEKKRADDLQKMYSELEIRYRETSARLAQATEMVLKLREDKAALEKQVAAATQAGFKPPETVLPPAEKLQGLVVAADNEARVAEINLGSDDGVVAPMDFYIYDPRAGDFLAKLVIRKVGRDRSTGDLTVIRGKVEKGNHVTNRFD
jgi:hypothetical protein